jgi:hypothetical protein
METCMRFTGVISFIAALASAPAVMACPDWQLPPAFGTIQLNEGFPQDPYTRNITAGGHYSLAGCFGSNQYTGSVAAKPDFDVQYNTSGASSLTFIVDSGYDTMLLVNDPNGEWWFDDDSYGAQNPQITIRNAPPGLYDVWIGSFQGGSGLPGTLYISERY